MSLVDEALDELARRRRADLAAYRSQTGRQWASRQGHAAAAQRNTEIARLALDNWNPAWPETWRQVASVRLHCPTASWAQIAQLTGLTYAQAVYRFASLRRRMEGQVAQ